MVSVCLPSDALSQHLLSYLGFSYPGRGVSLHGCSSKAQPLLSTLDERYLLTAAPPDLGRGVDPPGHHPWPPACCSSSWSNRQIWPWSMEWSKAKANRVLPRERTGHNKHSLPTTQKKTTHGHHQMVNTEIRLIIFFAAKDGEALYSQQNLDLELTAAQIRNSLLPNSDLNWRK